MNLDEDIATLDLECVAFKVAWDEKWPLETIDKTEMDYRWFLQAVRLAPTHSIVPEKHVDIFWHHHILDTRKYIDDCQRLFGRYIHHFPYSGVIGNEDATIQKNRSAESQTFILSLKQSTL